MKFKFVKTIKPVGNTGHITIPKRHIGKKAKIIIIDNDEGKDENGEERDYLEVEK
jgi:hypothetical protein